MQNYEFSSHANQTLYGTLLSAKMPLSPALVNRIKHDYLKMDHASPFFPPQTSLRLVSFISEVCS